MAKKTKESQPLSIRMDINIYRRLETFCEKSGQSKTIAIERALDFYLHAYEEEERRLVAEQNVIQINPFFVKFDK